MTLDADGGAAANVGPKLVFAAASASGAEFPVVTGMIAKGFAENESDKEPSKSVSALIDVEGAGAAESGPRGSNSSKVSNSCFAGDAEGTGALAGGLVLSLTGATGGEEGLGADVAEVSTSLSL